MQQINIVISGFTPYEGIDVNPAVLVPAAVAKQWADPAQSQAISEELLQDIAVTVTNVTLDQFKGKWVILLFFPMDWTFVCPTELLAYNDAKEKLAAVNAVVLGISGDSPFTHLSWLRAPREQGGLGGLVTFPLLSDITRETMKAYGVYNEDTTGIDYAQAFRGLFLIDPKRKIRHIYINDNGVGRNVEETIRVIKALQFSDKHGEVCPANWHEGQTTFKPDSEGVSKYLVSLNK
mgnify:CR=1 FL=1